MANPVQLQQVFINLIRNSCEALDTTPVESRRIRIRTSIVKNVVEVTVEDNGSGISEEASQKMFEPFFTTKAKGLGLGMAISKNIIRQHDGNIWFTSPSHEGTTFHFTLPVFQAK
jgi:two-component system sensor kinase FixL